MTRRYSIVIPALVVALAAAAGAAQRTSAGSDARFDVISVKRVAPGTPPSLTLGVPPGQMAVRAGGRFAAPWVTVRDLLRVAHGVNEVQVVGGPEWMATHRFDIEATTRPDVTADEARRMIQSLLADRFSVVSRMERRELPVSVLEMARGDRRPGPQLRPSGPECQPPSRPPGLTFVPAPPPPPPAGTQPSLVLTATAIRCLALQVSWHISLREVTMEYFAARLIPVLGRVVLDRTGLMGTYDLDLTFMPDPLSPPMVNGAAITLDAPALPAALRDQLGLTLETAPAPVEVVIIERVEPPTEN